MKTVLEHKWLLDKKPESLGGNITKFILKRLSTFKNYSKFKKAVLMYIVLNVAGKDLD
jgi:hypothetical protein